MLVMRGEPGHLGPPRMRVLRGVALLRRRAFLGAKQRLVGSSTFSANFRCEVSSCSAKSLALATSSSGLGSLSL